MPDARPEIVTLVVDGFELRGWQSVTVNRSMKDAAITFSLGATNPAWSEQARLLRHGKEIEIRTTPEAGPRRPGGGDLLCKGYIDDYESEIGEDETREVRVSGRSKAGDAIDCPPVKHKTGRVERKTLLQVAQEFDEWGIGFSADIKLDPIPKVQREPAEPLFTTLEREARHVGAMLAGQPDGSVKITRAGTKRHAGALSEGASPVRSVKVKVSIKDKKSARRVRGQRGKGTGKKNLRQEQVERDPSVTRHRPEIVLYEGDGDEPDLKRRARWRRLRQQGSGTTVEFGATRPDGSGIRGG